MWLSFYAKVNYGSKAVHIALVKSGCNSAKVAPVSYKTPTDDSDKRNTKVSANIPLRSKVICRFPGLWNATSPNVAEAYRDSRRFWCYHNQQQCSSKRRDRPRKQSSYEWPSELQVPTLLSTNCMRGSHWRYITPCWLVVHRYQRFAEASCHHNQGSPNALRRQTPRI